MLFFSLNKFLQNEKKTKKPTEVMNLLIFLNLVFFLLDYTFSICSYILRHIF